MFHHKILGLYEKYERKKASEKYIKIVLIAETSKGVSTKSPNLKTRRLGQQPLRKGVNRYPLL